MGTSMLVFRTKKIRKAEPGVVMVLFAGIAMVLLAVMGISLYVGLSAYIQGELHEMTNTAAGTAARALYDDFDRSTWLPALNEGDALAAGQNAFDTMAAANNFIADMAPQLTLTGNGNNRVDASVSATLVIPLMAAVGLNQLNFTAASAALYAQNEVGGICDSETWGTDDPPNPQASCMNPQAGPYSRTIDLDLPVYDGGGWDLYINTGQINDSYYHGIRLAVCTSDIPEEGLTGTCQPIVNGAVPYNDEGVVILRDLDGDGTDERILYGKILIDLSVDNIQKGTTLQVIDDGIHDGYTVNSASDPGTRVLELIPTITQPSQITTFHHAILCQGASCDAVGNARLVTNNFTYN